MQMPQTFHRVLIKRSSPEQGPTTASRAYDGQLVERVVLHIAVDGDVRLGTELCDHLTARLVSPAATVSGQQCRPTRTGRAEPPSWPPALLAIDRLPSTATGGSR